MKNSRPIANDDRSHSAFRSHLGPSPAVSVIIRTSQGRLGFLKEAVQSALAQHHRPLELVVVETRSQSARSWLRACPRLGGQAIVYRPLGDLGASAAGNAGLEASSGDFLMFLNDDQVLFERHVQSLLHGLRKSAQCGAAYSVAYEAPTHVQSWDPLTYQEIDRFIVHRQPFSRPLLQQRNFLPLQSVLFRRELYVRYGGMNQRVEGLEDWELWRRYSEHAPFQMVDEVTSLHRVPVSAAQAAVRYQKMRQSQVILQHLNSQSSQPSIPAASDPKLPFNGPRSAIRDRVARLMTGNRLLFRVYWHGRRLYYRWRKSA